MCSQSWHPNLLRLIAAALCFVAAQANVKAFIASTPGLVTNLPHAVQRVRLGKKKIVDGDSYALDTTITITRILPRNGDYNVASVKEELLQSFAQKGIDGLVAVTVQKESRYAFRELFDAVCAFADHGLRDAAVEAVRELYPNKQVFAPERRQFDAIVLHSLRKIAPFTMYDKLPFTFLLVVPNRSGCAARAPQSAEWCCFSSPIWGGRPSQVETLGRQRR